VKGREQLAGGRKARAAPRICAPRFVMVHRWSFTGPAHANAAALGLLSPLHGSGRQAKGRVRPRMRLQGVHADSEPAKKDSRQGSSLQCLQL
jgi:hypothetical protein